MDAGAWGVKFEEAMDLLRGPIRERRGQCWGKDARGRDWGTFGDGSEIVRAENDTFHLVLVDYAVTHGFMGLKEESGQELREVLASISNVRVC